MSQANRQPTRDKHKKPLPVVVYEPNSRVRHPIKLLQEMWYDLLASRELAWQLFQRDIQSQYRQSILGVLWIFIPPLVSAVGLTFLREARVLNLGDTPIPYPVYVALSMTLWQTFIQVFNNTMGAARSAKGMLMKLNVPPEAFILSKVSQTLFNFLIQLIPIFFLFVWFKVGVTWTILIAPVAFIHLILFGTGLGLILSPFSCLYGDVNKAISFVTRLWLFVTPVIYPQPREGFWAILVKINPVTPLLVTTRDLATTGEISNVAGFWIASAVAIILTLFGWIFYRLSLPFLVERA
ncbi:ABC transporter permease [Cyanothece sp. BG0011]|uniref:ABC transporter permease n=1 Tax=Cyanothece sp. BG0011 TaxID=2082950 RepID=UPI000D1DF36B|nr:ABC transporter permease [Cyanothece sp. BG0011]